MRIRRFKETERETYLEMAEAFYRSPAVLHPVPHEYFERTFDEMMRSDAYVDGYLLESDAGEPMGYLLVSKTFSQECGGQAVWVEELSVLPAFRGQGAGSEALKWVGTRYPQARRFRLEVEPENERAIELYRRLGYEELSYFQMIRDV